MNKDSSKQARYEEMYTSRAAALICDELPLSLQERFLSFITLSKQDILAPGHKHETSYPTVKSL